MLEHLEPATRKGLLQEWRGMLDALQKARRGVTALEYGIVAGFLGLAIIAIFRAFTPQVSGMIGRFTSSL